ncbi:nitrogen fixation protein NifQ [Azomonas agilis]|uniref:Nitrogen fixation protein NifQ n=1 Tax=Azomonas agilis TaxID=116849 RepID=A0A562J2Q3_9GAMM|nr:nitrogen fixation protein NifQ [Azomonas agilis]TWH77427.1 nitrogen fixation protein NifQ [Azomonas agilis]
MPSQNTLDNRRWLKRIFQAQRLGNTCLPDHLGLDQSSYQRLSQQLNIDPPSTNPLHQERNLLREDLLQLRQDEWQQLQDLLLAYLAGKDPENEQALARVITAACLGTDHLWRDLGLESRQMLRDLLECNVPELVRKNTQNMRWKRFFYKQLCEQEGSYVCRSPTCEQCTSYNECFGDEH